MRNGSLELQLQRAREHLEQEREWIQRCGGNREGYRLRYASAYDDPKQPDLIFAADIAQLQKAEERVRELEAKLNKRAERALAAAKKVSRDPLDPGEEHVVSYRAECSCGYRGDAFTDITAARRDGQHHDKARRLVEALRPGATRK